MAFTTPLLIKTCKRLENPCLFSIILWTMLFLSIKGQLERVCWFLRQAGVFSLCLHSTVHIVGTNGKWDHQLPTNATKLGTLFLPLYHRFNLNGLVLTAMAIWLALSRKSPGYPQWFRRAFWQTNGIWIGHLTHVSLLTLNRLILLSLVDDLIRPLFLVSLSSCTSIGFHHTGDLGFDIANHKCSHAKNTPILLGRVSAEVEHFFNCKSHGLYLSFIGKLCCLKDNQTIQISLWPHWESPP